MDNSQHNLQSDIDLLRFTTVGSVDDGKSTLIGRLLYDSKSILDDQLEALQHISQNKGKDNLNLAYLTDGLKAEREQGITIDVAYRYFATSKRKFIIADTPGHLQYTRNMVTGASTADLAIILIDARKGVLEQTKRHTYIANLLGINHILVCINKMDLVNWNQQIFENIKTSFLEFSSKISIGSIHFIPISALNGDNIIAKSQHCKWYSSFTLIEFLESIRIKENYSLKAARFPIQYVIKPQQKELADFRAYAGRVASGTFKIGDNVTILPSKKTTNIKSIYLHDKEISEAQAHKSITITLHDEIDVSRGNMIVKTTELPTIKQELEIIICWMSEQKLLLNGKYAILHTSNQTKCIIKSIDYKLNINSLEKNEEDKVIELNDIAKITIKTMQELFFDAYKMNRITGSLILIDEQTNDTVAAGMIL